MPAEFFVLRPLFADLKATVVDAPDPVTVGQNVTYTFTVRDQGPTYSSNTTLTDVLPATMTYVSATPSQGTCTGTTTVVCNLGRVDHDATATVTHRRPRGRGGDDHQRGRGLGGRDRHPRGRQHRDRADHGHERRAGRGAAGARRRHRRQRRLPAERGRSWWRPTWRNIGTAAITLTGAATNLHRPRGPDLHDPRRHRGVRHDRRRRERAACSDCYGFSVNATARPALHWDRRSWRP